MPVLTIDNRKVEVSEGRTILEAAEKIGIEIPTMCFLKGCKPSTSCMICVVKVEGKANFVPSCAAIAEDGMVVHTRSEEIDLARKAALELLLSDHLGDCMGPCQTACPAHMNIPLMIRQISEGRLDKAIATVKKNIALPAVLGRICPKPCEKACRRSGYDEGVSICLLKRFAADVDLLSEKSYIPVCKPKINKSIAIIGAGPAGLAAAYYLSQNGFACTILDDHEKPGGMLQYGVPEKELPRNILNSEISQIEKLGVRFRLKTRVGDSVTFESLRKEFDAVFVAIGQLPKNQTSFMGLKIKVDAIDADSQTYQTNLPGVFAGGDAVRKRKLTVRAVADGKEACAAISQYLSGEKVTGRANSFNTRIGKLSPEELEKFVAGHSKDSRIEPARNENGFTNDEAIKEAIRCLHCDCRKPVSCKLRKYSGQYDAKISQYKGKNRSFVQLTEHSELIFEPGKCIECGLCVQITAKAGEKIGLTFTGRGFNVRLAIPFERSIVEAIQQTNTAKKCVKACPTGALSFKISDGDEQNAD
ncbi:MAG: FAD-dependent oxidoreductase [Sedimentisphaerales bacterium]|nr:FAD-dependent oxidoreductase [Sedimentisphaerales bacterium]